MEYSYNHTPYRLELSENTVTLENLQGARACLSEIGSAAHLWGLELLEKTSELHRETKGTEKGRSSKKTKRKGKAQVHTSRLTFSLKFQNSVARNCLVLIQGMSRREKRAKTKKKHRKKHNNLLSIPRGHSNGHIDVVNSKDIKEDATQEKS